MKSSRGPVRRQPPGSPFAPPVVQPLEQFEVQDRVTHDSYGLGSVVLVEDQIAVHVDFGSRQERIVAPYSKLTKL